MAKRKIRFYRISIIVALVLACFYFMGLEWDTYQPVPKKKIELPSEHTIVTAVLDSPLPANKNVIWCSSLQMAWNTLKNNVIGEDIQIIGAQSLADKLNRAPQTSTDLTPESYFSAAGYGPSIVQKIQQGMKQKFPDKVLYDFGEVRPNDIISYAYLLAEIKFTKPYFENDRELIFTDAQGKQTPITSFSTISADDSAKRKLSKQIDVLYVDTDEETRVSPEFALDLDNKSKPYQIIVAMIEPKATLSLTLSSLEDKIDRFTKEHDPVEFTEYTTLIVPNIHFKVLQTFDELTQKFIGNNNYTEYIIANALQEIDFRLDRNGAVLESRSMFLALAGSRWSYVFDKPFLVVIKKRDAEHPFFVMWIGNAELLDEFKEQN